MNSRAGFMQRLLELWAFFGDPLGSMRGPKGGVLSPYLPSSLPFTFYLWRFLVRFYLKKGSW